MTVPAYAAHFSEEKYNNLKQYWPYIGDYKTNFSDSYHLKGIETVDDAAALILIAALDEETKEIFFGNAKRLHGVGNDGRGIGSISALFQYHKDISPASLIRVIEGVANQQYDLGEEDEIFSSFYLAKCLGHIKFDLDQTVCNSLMKIMDRTGFSETKKNSTPFDAVKMICYYELYDYLSYELRPENQKKSELGELVSKLVEHTHAILLSADWNKGNPWAQLYVLNDHMADEDVLQYYNKVQTYYDRIDPAEVQTTRGAFFREHLPHIVSVFEKNSLSLRPSETGRGQKLKPS